MKTVLMIIAIVFLLMAGLATPIAIGLGIYDWAISDMEFKLALWEGFKSWVIMIALGLGVGFPCYIASQR